MDPFSCRWRDWSPGACRGGGLVQRGRNRFRTAPVEAQTRRRLDLATSEEHLLRAEYQSLRARSAVIVNGVDGERFQPADAVTRERFRAELGVGEDHFLIGFVGHEFSRKGLPVLLEALAGLDDHFRLLVVGGSAEMVRQGERTARSHGVRGRVAFVGRVDDPSSLIACTDALCLPSAYEASPLVVLESLACGVPVVSTRTGSTPDVLTPGEDGYLVERDAKGIADALRDIRASSIDFPAKARATAERHSWSAVALRYLEVFDRVLLEQRKPVS
jgi:UDP-glucose:(heptosyl)LPS alpha-1,3-glucosyltransferase